LHGRKVVVFAPFAYSECTMNERIFVLIPARFQSSRFPGKPLALILGKPMIEWVYNGALKSGFETYVVTDDIRIKNCVENFGGKVLMIEDDVPSGSERISLAYQRFLADKNPSLIINAQGDEPLLDGRCLRDLAEFHLKSNFDVTTLTKIRASSEADYQNPNVVKAVMAQDGKCLYFSRAMTPFNRDNQLINWHQHIGVYSFKPKTLIEMNKLKVSLLENIEKLEQLRLLENGYSIGAIETKFHFQGVDTKEDIAKVEEFLSE
jgi:3-deoxy-manno-octulosonate cytidylyltransferase (CMP-KDO synthetase)